MHHLRASTSCRVSTSVSAPRCTLMLAVTSALCGAPLLDARAQAFPSVIELGSLSGPDGFRLDGRATLDRAGFSVSAAGDINSDGIDDLIVGVPYADPDGNSAAGSSYVVFGKNTATAGLFPATLALDDLDGSNGFRLDGQAVGDRSGHSVSAAGDINGDGIDDLIVGAPYAQPNGSLSGSSYVVFGRNTAMAGLFPAMLALGDLDGSNGFRLDGAAAGDFFGGSVSAAGDINGDGIDDLIVGAFRADPVPPDFSFGSSYVVFGKDTVTVGPFPATLALADLDGSNGFRLDGEAANDFSGRSVSAAGDINGDGVDDLVIGADGAAPNASFNAGSSYVVFGKNTAMAGLFPAIFALGDLDGSNGFRLDGQMGSDRSGFSVSAAGDINGDGIDEVIIGAYRANPDGNVDSGSSYVVFGKNTAMAGLFPAIFALCDLDGSNGFRLDGQMGSDRSGLSVSAAGDINGDGIDEVIIGASRADPDGNIDSGSSYVVFGKDIAMAGSFPATLALGDLDGSNGFRLDGQTAGDLSGRSVSAAGDINGDGIDDLIIGAYDADPNGNFNSGSSYVVFGRTQGPVVPSAVAVPGMNGWGMGLLGGLLAWFAWWRRRQGRSRTDIV